MKIYDGFLFNDEFDLLELRLMELYDYVDRFVLVESPLTFTQKPKPLHFWETRERFKPWLDKIHPIVAKTPNEPHPVIEHESRRQILEGFDCEFNDMILLGDVDEIPSRQAIELIRKTPPAIPMVMRQHLYYYRVTNHAGFWNGTIAMPRGIGRIDLQEIRDARNFLNALPVDTCGWHFSWLGDSEDVKKKLGALDVARDAKLYGSQLESIPDPEKDAKTIERVVAIGDDLFGREKSYQTMILQPGVLQPESIKDWLVGKDKYV